MVSGKNPQGQLKAIHAKSPIVVTSSGLQGKPVAHPTEASTLEKRDSRFHFLKRLQIHNEQKKVEHEEKEREKNQRKNQIEKEHQERKDEILEQKKIIEEELQILEDMKKGKIRKDEFDRFQSLDDEILPRLDSSDPELKKLKDKLDQRKRDVVRFKNPSMLFPQGSQQLRRTESGILTSRLTPSQLVKQPGFAGFTPEGEPKFLSPEEVKEKERLKEIHTDQPEQPEHETEQEPESKALPFTLSPKLVSRN